MEMSDYEYAFTKFIIYKISGRIFEILSKSLVWYIFIEVLGVLICIGHIEYVSIAFNYRCMYPLFMLMDVGISFEILWIP